MSKFQLPENKELAAKVLDNESKERQMGIFGLLFGTREHAPTNIAGSVLIISLFGLLAIAFFHVEESVRPDLMKAFSGIALTALGFLFGYTAKE